VGQKTAACVLLFSLRRPAMPVDTHVQRVSQRTGIVPPRASAVATQARLEALVPPDLYYPFHMLFIRHGRTLCTARWPKCPLCPVVGLCDYALSQGEAAAGNPTG
jgi:endonuclease-3